MDDLSEDSVEKKNSIILKVLCSIEEITENITSQKRKKRYWNII
jgi:hypothetical protein